MHTRIFVGVGAWLLGVATATGGSLLAVSLLGQGITGTSGLLLTPAAVNQALASEAAEPPGPSSPAAPAPPRSPAAGTTAAVPGASGVSSPAVTSAPLTAPAPTATVLTSRGGDVLASCLATGVYLESWSPLSGYAADDVRRGPAATARVRFESDGGSVTMVVSCSNGGPTAVTYSGSSGHGDD